MDGVARTYVISSLPSWKFLDVLIKIFHFGATARRHNAHNSSLVYFMSKPLALIVGVGDGLSASLARLLFANGYTLALAARNTNKLSDLANETQATCYACDATKLADVEKLFSSLKSPPRVVIYNPSRAVRGNYSRR